MNCPYIPDTIAACATAPAHGAVGVIRLSGSQSKDILSQIFRGKTAVSAFDSHHLYFGSLTQPATDQKMDEVLVVWMKGPHSFTGEDVVEIHTHGNPLLIVEILRVITSLGARLAGPGEFTQRAYLNGKMDLAQAEAVADLIAADNEWALKNALAQMGGSLTQIIGSLRQKIIHAQSLVEVGFDFGEEDVEFIKRSDLKTLIEEVNAEVVRLLGTFETGQLTKDGVRVALVGKPNVGKSSLLNALLEEEKAITHAEPGTTRDIIQGEKRIDGLPFHFLDTAGIRTAENSVEQEGIRRSQEALQKADIICLLLDLSRPLDDSDRDLTFLLQNKQVIVVGTKADLPAVWSFEKEIQLKEWTTLTLSSRTRTGLPELETQFKLFLQRTGFKSVHNYVLNNGRHRELLQNVQIKFITLLESLSRKSFKDDQISEVLRQVGNLLGEIVGEINSENILDEIFGKFCIGK